MVQVRVDEKIYDMVLEEAQAEEDHDYEMKVRSRGFGSYNEAGEIDGFGDQKDIKISDSDLGEFDPLEIVAKYEGVDYEEILEQSQKSEDNRETAETPI